MLDQASRATNSKDLLLRLGGFKINNCSQNSKEVPNRLISGHTLSSFCRRVEVSEITTTLPKLHSSSNDMNLETSNILENVELFKADVKQIYSRKLKYSIPSYFPMIDELCFVNFLFRNLDEVLNSNWSLESLTKPEIRTLCMKLSHLRSFIRNGERRIPDELWRRSISATYEVERLFDSILVRCNALGYLLFSLPSVLKEIELINKEFVKLCGSSLSLRSSRVAKTSPLISTRFGNKVVDEEPVGFEDDTEKLMQLMRESAEQDVISIVGIHCWNARSW
ncbi:hypothetical protein K7X08_002642 [Anisodus acutangulus]|uniref:Uncharacterized protein n=1 Tax=Anisodus acutangulus TaxID=402998 RepID=A0A9Q1LPK4_9SOLA|nr:hypothetical protein K7X08_002642 [Anisodus acutangulus]